METTNDTTPRLQDSLCLDAITKRDLLELILVLSDILREQAHAKAAQGDVSTARELQAAATLAGQNTAIGAVAKQFALYMAGE